MSEETEEIKLTSKQKLFADFYLSDARFNATEAAKMAKYSEKTARLTALGLEAKRID